MTESDDGAIRPEPVVTTPAVDVDQRPEILVGAAFAGGVVLALLLKGLGR